MIIPFIFITIFVFRDRFGYYTPMQEYFINFPCSLSSTNNETEPGTDRLCARMPWETQTMY